MSRDMCGVFLRKVVYGRLFHNDLIGVDEGCGCGRGVTGKDVGGARGEGSEMPIGDGGDDTIGKEEGGGGLGSAVGGRRRECLTNTKAEHIGLQTVIGEGAHLGHHFQRVVREADDEPVVAPLIAEPVGPECEDGAHLTEPAVGHGVEAVGEVVVITRVGVVGIECDHFIIACFPACPQPSALQLRVVADGRGVKYQAVGIGLDECEAVDEFQRYVRLGPVGVVYAQGVLGSSRGAEQADQKQAE